MSASRFDLAGPLPHGLTVLEASAGTGKTYTIAGLATRYIADGLRLPRLLVVTFTRAATAELRDRVRTRLVDAAEHLDRVVAGAGRDSDDPVLAWLTDAADGEVRERQRRIATALGEFDAATISTIHGFCQHMLAGIGLAGDVERSVTLLDDHGDVVEAVVHDLLVRTFHRDGGEEPPVNRRELLAIAEAVVGNPEAAIVPERPDEATAALRVRLAAAVRAEVDRRKRGAGVLSYDDLLTRLRAALRHRVHGDTARRRLRAKYDVALVDEFQDTDPIQWDILSQVFGDGRTLVLIGDPKQAIYSFRGADVHAYLAAARRSGAPATLDVNWRSDGDLLHAYNVLFDGLRLGHDAIAYRPVRAVAAHAEPRLVGAPGGAPLTVRVVRRDVGVRLTPGGYVQTRAAREHIARDLAAEVVALLDAGARIVERGRDGAPRPAEALRPGHIAVLVRTNAEATLVQATLRQAGVPAVINGVGSVFATPAASDWLRLLEALERPASRFRAATAVLTAFFGWTADRVAAADEGQWEAVHERLHRWAGVLRDGSVAALLHTVTAAEGLAQRLLSQPDGERRITDLTHIGELLHAAATGEELGPTALSGWLRQRVAEADDDLGAEERARRLESDAEGVQVLTIHRSKGLEFPVVYCPFLWSAGGRDIGVPVFHDDGGRRSVDVAGAGSAGFDEHKDAAEAERRGEDLRLLYVALTRARHRAVLWWAPAPYGEQAPLSRVLFCRRPGGAAVNAGSYRIPRDDDAALARLSPLAASADGRLAITGAPAHADLPRWTSEAPRPEALEAARFDRSIDRAWRRTSYSAIVAFAEEPLVGSEADERVVEDEPAAEEAGVDAVGAGAPGGALAPGGAATPGGALAPGGAARVATGGGAATQAWSAAPPLADLPGGADVGTFVHAVLEDTDFAADDLDDELARRVDDAARRRPVDVGDRERLAAGLRRVIETPLGALAGGRRLRDVTRADRLDELEFELPLAAVPMRPASAAGRPAGEPAPTVARPGLPAVTPAAVGDLLRAHLPAGDPLAGYAARLAERGLQRDLRGYLTGTIDLVVRLGAAGGGGARGRRPAGGADRGDAAGDGGGDAAGDGGGDAAGDGGGDAAGDGGGGPRFLVVDYKTNRLAGPGEPLTFARYHPAVLSEAMVRSHYPLQALLYTVALHRYLRWRLGARGAGAYDPERHLAGVLYLFVRGMAGPDTPDADGEPAGVFAWRPPAALVLALSDLLDRGRPAP